MPLPRPASFFRAVFITAPEKTAPVLARKLISARLAACVNIVPSVRSFYRWNGKIQDDAEVLLIVKTRASLFKKVAAFVSKNHPYEVPEIISLDLSAGSAPYLKWLHNETD